MKPVKIVVAGPPHSGKSVFLGGLTKNIPHSRYFLFRACPDGEGTWLGRHYNDPAVVALRRKGIFSSEMVDWYCQSLARCELAPIVLVDIGGRMTEENRRILTEGGVDFGIILAGDMEVVPAWQDFLTSAGVQTIAVLHSDYAGEEDSIESCEPVLRASAHYLERGDASVCDRPAIVAVAELIQSLIGDTKEKTMNDFVNSGVLSISAMAATLGKQAEERTLPNGKVVSQIVWEGSDLIRIAELVHNRSAELPPVVRIDGAAPAWLVSALVHEVHPRSASANSPDGYVAIGCKRPEGAGSGCDWTTTELGTTGNGRRLVKVEFALDPSTPLSPAQLDEIAPPEVNLGDVVIVSGRGPNWLVASVAMAYHGRAAACALFQPGTGSTVAWTHVQDVPLGSIIPG